MIAIKQLNNDLIAMEKQGLVKRCGYAYNGARDPEPKYQLTQGGSDKFWTYELEHLSDADKTTLERCGYRVTAEGLRRYIETQP